MTKQWQYLKEILDCFEPNNGHYQAEAEYTTLFCEELLTKPEDGIRGSTILEDRIEIYGPNQEELAERLCRELNG